MCGTAAPLTHPRINSSSFTHPRLPRPRSVAVAVRDPGLRRNPAEFSTDLPMRSRPPYNFQATSTSASRRKSSSRPSRLCATTSATVIPANESRCFFPSATMCATRVRASRAALSAHLSAALRADSNGSRSKMKRLKVILPSFTLRTQRPARLAPIGLPCRNTTTAASSSPNAPMMLDPVRIATTVP